MAHLLTDHAAKHGRHGVQAGARGQRQLAQHTLVQLSLQWRGEHSEHLGVVEDEARMPKELLDCLGLEVGAKASSLGLVQQSMGSCSTHMRICGMCTNAASRHLVGGAVVDRLGSGDDRCRILLAARLWQAAFGGLEAVERLEADVQQGGALQLRAGKGKGAGNKLWP